MYDIYHILFQVSASDLDYGKNGIVTYSIRETNSKFRINSTTGEIYTNEAIDREALTGSAQLPVNVLATDGGNLQATCSLLIRIIDTNDNDPVFEQTQYEFDVLNSRGIGDIVGIVVANDADIGNNARILYSFLENPGSYFRFDESSQFLGSFKVNKALPQNDGAVRIKFCISELT